MTTQPHGGTDPLSTTPDVPHTSTPIGDELAYDAGIDTDLDGPATPTVPPATSGDSADSGDSAKDKAKDKAQDALGSASEHASGVADTAKDEAGKVAGEAKEKATNLLSDAKSQVDEQSKTQLQNLSAKLGELADEIHDMVAGSEKNGTATDLAQQLAEKTQQLSSHLEGREPLDLVEDVRAFARRRPAAFIAGAAVAGVVAGRLTRGARADTPPASPTTGSSTPARTSTTPAPSTPVAGSSIDPDFVPAGQNTGGRQ